MGPCFLLPLLVVTSLAYVTYQVNVGIAVSALFEVYLSISATNEIDGLIIWFNYVRDYGSTAHYGSPKFCIIMAITLCRNGVRYN